MSFLTKPASFLRAAAMRPVLATAPRARVQVRFATQDYGSGAGNPAGEKPQQQGQNMSEGLEHPGPPPPKVARGQSSSSPNNDDTPSQGSNQSSSSSGSSGSSAQQSSGGGDKSSKGAQPKILSEDAPPQEESADVKQHNKEMRNKSDKAHQQADKE